MTAVLKGTLSVALGIVLFLLLAEVGRAVAEIRNLRVLIAIIMGGVVLLLIAKW